MKKIFLSFKSWPFETPFQPFTGITCDLYDNKFRILVFYRVILRMSRSLSSQVSKGISSTRDQTLRDLWLSVRGGHFSTGGSFIRLLYDVFITILRDEVFLWPSSSLVLFVFDYNVCWKELNPTFPNWNLDKVEDF